MLLLMAKLRSNAVLQEPADLQPSLTMHLHDEGSACDMHLCSVDIGSA